VSGITVSGEVAHEGELPASAPAEAGLAFARWLGVDWGDKRIGLALADELGMLATPLEAMVRREGKRPPVAELVRRIDSTSARGVLFGLPFDEAGDETPRCAEVRAVAAKVTERTGLPVRFVDERYSTAQALRVIRAQGGSTRGRKGDVDSLTAALLLEQLLRGGARA
jgi:putative Holliday junction resolvase